MGLLKTLSDTVSHTANTLLGGASKSAHKSIDTVASKLGARAARSIPQTLAGATPALNSPLSPGNRHALEASRGLFAGRLENYNPEKISGAGFAADILPGFGTKPVTPKANPTPNLHYDTSNKNMIMSEMGKAQNMFGSDKMLNRQTWVATKGAGGFPASVMYGHELGSPSDIALHKTVSDNFLGAKTMRNTGSYKEQMTDIARQETPTLVVGSKTLSNKPVDPYWEQSFSKTLVDRSPAGSRVKPVRSQAEIWQSRAKMGLGIAGAGLGAVGAMNAAGSIASNKPAQLAVSGPSEGFGEEDNLSNAGYSSSQTYLDPRSFRTIGPMSPNRMGASGQLPLALHNLRRG